MAPFDHSQTYRVRTFRNIPHRRRLKDIVAILTRELMTRNTRELKYADFGCSNGYIANLLTQKFRFQISYGFDSDWENLQLARERYPSIRFELFDLNRPSLHSDKFDLISCFETLEHVGNLDNALHNLLNHLGPRGLLLITVPIETGFRGMTKFLIKRFVYGDSLKQLPNARTLDYVVALARSRRMSIFRDNRDGWGTHFGFDFRDIDERLQSWRVNYKAFNRFTTRFYVVTGS